jgi:hypothetical protein
MDIQFTFAFLCTFILSFRHIASFLDTIEDSGSLSNSTDGHAVQPTNKPSLIVKFTKQTLRSVPKTALIADLAVLVVLMWSQRKLLIVGPNYCRLYPWLGRDGYEYWKNAKVADKDCPVAIDGYVANFFVM